MADSKSAQRRMLTRKLKALTPADRAEFSQRAIARLLAAPQFKHAATLAAYVSFGSEFPTTELLAAVLKGKKRLGLPRIDPSDTSMTIHAVGDLQHDLESHSLGFREPLASRPLIPLDEMDLLIVPGLGFDRAGNRLGRGAGYYDRFLARPGIKAFVCALAFECQIVDAILTTDNDIPVHCIFTEDRTIHVQAAL